MKFPRIYLLTGLFFEIFIRASAFLIALVKVDHRFAAERRLRGMLLSKFFSSSCLHIGRVQIENPARMNLGNGVKLYCGSKYVAGSCGSIKIGGGSHIAYDCILAGGGDIDIGSNCAISANVNIYSASNRAVPGELTVQNRERSFVKIGSNVFIGTSVTILPGVTIGDNTTIAAGAVVVKDVPANSIVAGVPARQLS